MDAGLGTGNEQKLAHIALRIFQGHHKAWNFNGLAVQSLKRGRGFSRDIVHLSQLTPVHFRPGKSGIGDVLIDDSAGQ